MRLPFAATLVGLAVGFASGASPPVVPPNPNVIMALPDKTFLHMLMLPLGRIEGTIRGRAIFDTSGTRAIFLAVFPGATLSGDWRSIDPVQAFVLDANRRTLTQLTIDGLANAVSWDGEQTVSVQDGDRRNRYPVAPPQGSLPAHRMADAIAAQSGAYVAQGGDGRFNVVKTDAGRYAVEQVGARALRIEGTARNGAFAVVGHFLVWVDGSGRNSSISRGGPVAVAPPAFDGSAYGDAITPILPLGQSMYQGAYRNGKAYFAFTYGVRRIVAQTSDLVTYSYPAVPADLSYTVGDGFGADANGGLYFGRPESDEVTFWRNHQYVHQQLTFPSQAGSENELEYAMARIAPGDPLWPPMRPDQDALDTAMLQWRLYPVGDVIGERWIASYLGRVLLGDSHGNFRFAGAPQFPFAVLGRTDDGRIWGASPQYRYFSQSIFTDDASTVWWTRDGVAWLEAATVPGDAGAVGLDHRQVWIALTHPWLGRASISLVRLGDSTPAITGGGYAGEQLFFASLPTGFYLVWGATPGRRLNGDQGTLCAYRIDQTALFGNAGMGLNTFAQQLFAPQTDPSLPVASFSERDVLPIVQPTLDTLATLPPAAHAILATNVDGVQVDPSRITLMSFDQERAFEIKYAGRAYPFAAVRVTVGGDMAMVTRIFMRGPLDFVGAVERWTKVEGRWQKSSASPWNAQP